MLSRVADTIYWMARYMERTHGLLQNIRTNYISSQDDIKDFSWRSLLNTYGNELSAQEINKVDKDTSRVFEYLILDKMNGSSAYNNISRSRENARAIQDHITKEVWQCLNDYYHFIREPVIEKQVKNGDPLTAIDLLIRHGLLFTGTIKNTMTRDESYAYLHIGKFLERSILTVDVLRMKFTEIDPQSYQLVDARELRYLLYSLFGYEIYIKTYKGHFTIENVLELVLYNNFFPHSLMYSLYQLNKYFERLKPESLPENYEQLEFLIGKILNNVKYSNLEAGNFNMLDPFLLRTRQDLIEIGSSFSQYYFGNT
jgi:uncharacterized alpha-E superfamily protein